MCLGFFMLLVDHLKLPHETVQDKAQKAKLQHHKLDKTDSQRSAARPWYTQEPHLPSPYPDWQPRWLWTGSLTLTTSLTLKEILLFCFVTSKIL